MLEVTVRWTKTEGTTEAVRLAGEFNNWQPESMEREEDGGWSKSLKLSAGRYMYKFVVGDQWVVNSDLPTEKDSSGNTNNVLEVEQSEGSGDSDSWEKVSIPEEPALTVSLVERMYCCQGSYQETMAAIKSLGAELEEETSSTLSYFDTRDDKLQRAGVWLSKSGSECGQWEVSSLTDSKLNTWQDTEQLTEIVQSALGSPVTELSSLVSSQLETSLEISLRTSRWLLGDTTLQLAETGAGLVTVRLQEAGDLVTATNSLQTKAANCNLSLFNARLAAIVS